MMNGALWVVVIAALFTTKWPELAWVTGSITAVLVVIVAVVYWIAVVTNDNDRADSTAPRESVERTKAEQAQGARNVSQERHSPSQQREEIAEAYWNALSRNLQVLRNKNLEALRSQTYEVMLHKHWRNLIEAETAGTIWATNFDERILRNWLVHALHHSSELSSVKSHRRAFTTRTLASIAAGEEETSGKVVVMVGSVRIEIQEDDPNKTTNVQITSPKTVVTNVTHTEERSQQKPQENDPQPRTTNSLR
jgi:hypothetical protein